VPKLAAPLTATHLRQLKPPATGVTEVADGGCAGLRLRISAGGDRGWSLLTTDPAGRRRRFELGGSPELGLAEARAAAHALRARVKAGHDPLAEKRASRARGAAARQGQGTLMALVEAYGAAGAAANRSWGEARKRIRSVFAPLAGRAALDLTLAELQRVVDAHPSKACAAQAVRFVRPALKWAVKRGLFPPGIARELEQPKGSRRVRQRVLSESELRAVLAALDMPELAGAYADCVRWLLLTGCRLSEAVDATAAEIVDGIWTIPGGRTKAARDHTVPLPRQARALLVALGRGPGERLFPNRAGGPLDNWDRWQKRLFAVSGTADWHRHDLRRSVATALGEAGIAPHVVEIVLGHAVPHSTLASVYNTSRYRDEHRASLQLWADRLDDLKRSQEQGDESSPLSVEFQQNS
jgi:integrase